MVKIRLYIAYLRWRLTFSASCLNLLIALPMIMTKSYRLWKLFHHNTDVFTSCFAILFIRVLMSSMCKLHSVECRASWSIRKLSRVSTIHDRSGTKGLLCVDSDISMLGVRSRISACWVPGIGYQFITPPPCPASSSLLEPPSVRVRMPRSCIVAAITAADDRIVYFNSSACVN